MAFRVVKDIYIGGEFFIGKNPNSGQYESMDKMSYGGFLACKLPLNNHLSVWASGGYFNTTTKDYKISTPVDQGPPYYSTPYPSTSELGIK